MTLRRGSAIVVFVAGVLAGVAGAGAFFHKLGSTGTAARAPADDVGPRAAPTAAEGVVGEAPPRALRASADDMHERIRASVAAAMAAQRKGDELQAFLDEIEARVRQQGKLTALELRTGLAALDAAYPDDPDRAAAFARRLEDIGRQLERPNEQPGGGVSPDIAALAQIRTIEAAAPGPDRDRLTLAAVAAIDRLPVDEQGEALKRLDRATAGGAAPAAPPDLDRILSDLRHAAPGGEARRGLIDDFLRATTALSVEEQERRLRELDAATAAAAAAN